MRPTKSTVPTKPTTSSARRPVEKQASPPAATPSEAQRLAAAILEVLAGVRSPSAAAELLAISLPRYYQLEARALEGLVACLAPRRLGKQPSLENRVKQLEKELAVAHRACARQEALVRVTQRSLGLAALATPKTPAALTPGKSRKPRKPMVRALRAAQQLRAQANAAAAGLPQETSLQPIAPTGGAEEPRP
jgi:hypothetical protein